jgi:hypothetical protein
MSVLARRLLEIDDALSAAGLSHAFGGAIALAYCTHEPRGTRDLDVNVFVDPSRAGEVFTALPAGVAVDSRQIEAAARDGQVRVWWHDTPVDVFLNIHAFHGEVARGVRRVRFGGRTIPVLGCRELAVFKAFLGRTKDWADIEAMVERGAIDIADAVASLQGIVGAEHPAVGRMAALQPV